MAPKMMDMSLLAILLTVLYAGAAAQSSCTNAIVSMSPCLNYITGNSSTPGSSCCSTLSSVVKASPQCLCQVLNGGGSQLGLSINQTQALQLPKACNVQTPPASQCNAAATPSDSPTTSKTGNGSQTVPAPPNVDSSNGSSTSLPSILLAFLLSAISYASF